MEHYGVRERERELQWRSRRSKRDVPNVFHSALRRCETHSQRISLAPPRTPLKLSLLHSIVFHIALRGESGWNCYFCSMNIYLSWLPIDEKNVMLVVEKSVFWDCGKNIHRKLISFYICTPRKFTRELVIEIFSKKLILLKLM